MVPSHKLTAVLIGEGTLLIRCADWFLQAGHTIVTIISVNSAIQDWAKGRGVPVIHAISDLEAQLTPQSFDFLFSIVNPTVLPDAVISLPSKIAINFHDGPLPRHGGMYATTWAIMAGESTHGVTWHTMTAHADAGPIVRQQVFPITPEMTAFELNGMCYEAGFASFVDLLDDIQRGTLRPVPHALDAATFHRRYQRPIAAAVIDWSASSDEIVRLVNALAFGPVPNPVAVPKILVGEAVLAVTRARKSDVKSTAAPGTLVSLGADGARVATATTDVILQSFADLDGSPIESSALATQFDFGVGQQFGALAPATAIRLTLLAEQLARREAFWVYRLQSQRALEVPYQRAEVTGGQQPRNASRLAHPPIPQLPSILQPDEAVGDGLAAMFLVYLARLACANRFDVLYRHEASRQGLDALEQFVAAAVPLRIDIPDRSTVAEALVATVVEARNVRSQGTFLKDLVMRHPEIRGHVPPTVAVEVVNALTEGPERRPIAALGVPLTVAFSADGSASHWDYDPASFPADAIAAMQEQFLNVFAIAARTPALPLTQVSLLTDVEQQRLLEGWNTAAAPLQFGLRVHDLIAKHVQQTPERIALVFEGECLTYRELDQRAERLARRLRGLGVRRDAPVGVSVRRSADLVVAMIGILKAGGAYVPLDPAYPAGRIAFMRDDVALQVIVTERKLLARFDGVDLTATCIEDLGDAAPFDAGPLDIEGWADATPSSLAYIIYTSGSTGHPKGVMVEHRNVVNFFVGMDARIAHEQPGTWLAVTSPSFDISVLELLWTLSRGFTVVVQGDDDRYSPSPVADADPPHRAIGFSLMYFASDEGAQGTEKYRLLLEGARFADEHGFEAVWTPERHFHAFGGLYPNPSVASAALAAITKRVAIRAGSCVLPINHPVRIAEDWALVDNLSGGRVGVSFASGWQPNDFVLDPTTFTDRKAIMLAGIETVRRLWRGEAVRLPGPLGDVDVRTLPRPIQPELPIWLTAASNPETFRLAGEIGASVLTHMLGQTVTDVAENIAVYRRAWREAGHGPGDGHVTLMLHTFVGDSLDGVRQTVRDPMKAYLRSSVDLIEKAAWSFPTFGASGVAGGLALDHLDDETMDGLVDHAFERYFETCGLFGTPERCLGTVDRLVQIGVDEVACLIDFGVDTETVLSNLNALRRLKDLVDRSRSEPVAEDYSIAAQIERHGVTHLQCTPSMARMLVEDERTRRSLSGVREFLVGGEPLPLSLAHELTRVVGGRVQNMYGPTETTVWSSCWYVEDDADAVSIGNPIANTRLYVLDAWMQPVPNGATGELYIGGAGVVRGYWGRDDLTRERFLPDPFTTDGQARMYRTGDLARYRPDGGLEMLGRVDHQVKLRGYRIELGEVEAVVAEDPAVASAVAVVREDRPGDRRLVAYVVARPGVRPDELALRSLLRERLPDYMVPAHVVVLPGFPLTPNGKTDRLALPPPSASPLGETVVAPPQTSIERNIADVWGEVLGLQQVNTTDSFFDLGGHSLLMVRAQQRLRDALGLDLSITELFQYPSVRSLADHLTHRDAQPAILQEGVRRAEARRAMLGQRRGLRNPT